MSSPISMADAIRQSILYQLNFIHTCLPGAIVSYDYTKQKAAIQPLLNKISFDDTDIPLPILQNVPVVFPRSGGASLTFPVSVGDTCLIIFIERSIDLWKTNGGQVTPDDNRKFNLSDGVAIMGLFPFSENSKAENNSDVMLTYNDSSIKIKNNGDVIIETASKIAIGNSVTELLQEISDTLAAIQLITVTVPSGGSGGIFPINNTATFSSLQVKIDAIKGLIS